MGKAFDSHDINNKFSFKVSQRGRSYLADASFINFQIERERTNRQTDIERQKDRKIERQTARATDR